MSEFVYDKIWSELSQKDRIVARGIAETESGKIKEIREHLGMETNEFNPYRKRLIKMSQPGQRILYMRVARKIACLHADLASTAITRETRKACFL